MLVARGGCVCQVQHRQQWQLRNCPRQRPAAAATGRGCGRAPPSLSSRRVLAGLSEPVALPEAHSNSAELVSGPSGTIVTHNPLGGLCLFRRCRVSPGLPTSGIGSKQVSHLPETVVGIQGPFLSLASQHGALQSMWG